jgi:hypothetical protein
MDEEAMRGYGFEAAVRRSRRIGELAVSDDPVGRSIFKVILPVADGVPALKWRMFGARSQAA